MLTLYIARHGQTEWNIEKRMQGWEDSNLTALGLANANALGERLKGVQFQAAYSSPSGRAVDSARAMLQNRSIPFITDDRLKEISIGRWEGKTYDEIKQSDPDLLEAYFNAPETYMPDEGESFYDFEKRVSQAYEFILRRHREGNVLIVSHSVFILMLLNVLKKRPVSELWNSSYVHDTALAVVTVSEDGSVTIEREGDGKHRVEAKNATW
ncbi:histidine phosphatase family protein [Bacillus haynesii]|uniref:histidine phosphatase family protein n=1 Tax=Bacillus haynesii TaxID=1925021 RepID=UPI002280F76A|nr:histidine phosphatase family protein [Bacillus haynesii]MCY8438563.1 histidine phosphatase family protein [Bacillus haynesii]MCY9154624.1 histidine phosphatase family protein [Bacillus haynesii]MCY9452657.1 histidine phosphatase family protein [Bacillus haynesii]